MSAAGHLSRIRRLAVGAMLMAWAALGLLAWVGCDDPVDLCEPGVPSGVLQGRVRSGGLPLEATVIARYLDDDFQTSGDFKSVPDASGFYSLDLPQGRYTLQLRLNRGRYEYSHLGLSYGQFPPDTLEVDGANSLLNIDFDLGGVTLDLEFPDYLQGQDGGLFLFRWEEGEWVDDDSLVDSGFGEIAGGRLEVTIAGVLPGEYRVQAGFGCGSRYCSDDSYGEVFWMPGTHDIEESSLYVVGPDSVSTLTGSLFGEPARLEGRVSGAWLSLGFEENPQLSFVTEDSLLTLRRMWVAEDGSFSAGFLLPDPVKLMVSQGGIDHWIGGPGFAEATVFSPQPGETISGIEFVQCGIHLVVDDSGLPLHGGRVRVYDGTGSNLVTEVPSYARTDRHIAIPNLWPGEYLIHITPDYWSMGSTEWRPQWFDRADDVAQAQPVVLASAGEVARRDVVMELGGKILGSVTRESDPVIGYRLLVYPADADTTWAEDHVWQEGFAMMGLPDGDYVIAAVPWLTEPNDPVWFPSTLDRAEAQVIEIRDASVFEGADIILPF